MVYSSQGHAVVQVVHTYENTYRLSRAPIVLCFTCCVVRFVGEQVVVMTVDIKSGYRNKTNVLTYIFRYRDNILHENNKWWSLICCTLYQWSYCASQVDSGGHADGVCGTAQWPQYIRRIRYMYG